MIFNEEIMDIAQLKQKTAELRIEAVRMVHEGNDGHPGPALSIADIVTALFFQIMRINPKEPGWEDRDRFILSKGHACPVYYAALSHNGYFGEKIRDFQLRGLGSTFQGHPVMGKTPGVDMTSGSLGNGISIGTGMAIAGKYRKKDYRVFVIVGDGELQEGVCWEGIAAAAAHKLDNLFVFIDNNHWQSGGTVEATVGSWDLTKRFAAFDWDVQSINGHDIDQIIKSVDNLRGIRGKPHAIICETVKGKGLSFMENDNSWHKRVPTVEQMKIALKELEVAHA
jgi:transketolase